MGSTTQRVEVLLLALVVAVVAGIAVVVGVVRPRPVPVVVDVQPLSSIPSATAAAPGAPTVPTVAATAVPTVAATAVPTLEPTDQPTAAPSATRVPPSTPTVLPGGDPAARPAGLASALPSRAWWLGGGLALVIGLSGGVVLRWRRSGWRATPPLAITSGPVVPLALPPRQLPTPPAAADVGTVRSAAASRTLLDERPVLPTLELGDAAVAGRTLLSRSLLTVAPDDVAEPDGPELEVVPDLAESHDDARPLLLAGVITAALMATGTRSLWLGLEWRGRHATALFAFADDADATLLALAARIAAETGTRWRWTVQGLQIGLPRVLDPPPRPWPLLLPVLTVERGATRALLLDRWRHLAVYGAQALGVTHQLLTQLLTEHAPHDLAVALIDPHGLLGTLYRAAPHRLVIDQPPALLLGQCLHALRQGHAATARPLLLVVVDPDDATITALLLLLRWLQPAPQAPLHLVVVTPGVRPAGRDLYALLPGLVTAGGSGDARLLPGVPEHWPRGGTAQVVSRAGRWSGQPLVLDEATVMATVAQLPACDLSDAPPTLWHAGQGGSALVVAPEPAWTSTDSVTERVTSSPPGVPVAPLVVNSGSAAGAAVVVTDPPGDGAGALSLALAPGDRGVTRLQALIDGAPEVPRAAVQSAPPEALPDAADAAWPADLAPAVRAGDLRQLWTVIVDDGGYHPTLRGGSGAQAGLTLRRLRGLAPEQLQAALPRLLVWFDRAGLLHPPTRDDLPFGMPRRPISTELPWIAQQLLATPPPPVDDPLVLALSRKRGERTP